MDQEAFDLISRRFASRLNRRTLAGVAGLGLAAVTTQADNVDAKKKKKKKKKKTTTPPPPTCKPDAAAKTCAGTCGSVTNNCQQQVNCGACGCTNIANVGTLQIAIDGTPAGGTLTLCGQHITLNQAITLRRNITIRGAGIGTTVIDGNNVVRPFIVDAGVTVAMGGISIINGAPTGLQDSGGGVSNRGALTLTQVEIKDCRGQGGGAISSSGRLELSDGVRIHDNEATTGGGGIEAYGTTSELIIGSNCEIYDNTAKHAGGVAVYNGATATMLGNSAIYGNTATVNGGGIHVYLGTLLMMSGSIVGGYEEDQANEAGNAGGGVMLERGSVTMEAGSNVAGNVGKYGGGIYVSNNDTTLKVKSGSRIVSNTGDVVGGGGLYSNGGADVENGALVCDNTPANSQCAGAITGACPQPANGICGIPKRAPRQAATRRRRTRPRR